MQSYSPENITVKLKSHEHPLRQILEIHPSLPWGGGVAADPIPCPTIITTAMAHPFQFEGRGEVGQNLK